MTAAPAVRFVLPTELSATEPPEARGLARDEVRLLVAGPEGVEHARFADLARFLDPGDLVVVNRSATVARAIDGTRSNGAGVVAHFATPLDDGGWLVELRTPGAAAHPILHARTRERVVLRSGAIMTLVAPHGGPPEAPADARGPAAVTRLWRADVAVEGGAVAEMLAREGRPISYGYLHGRWPLAAYQTVFAREPGSAEMPSAGRPFTTRLVTELVSTGIAIAPILLHTGVSSLERGEAPPAERFLVPAATARLVQATRSGGGRVIAVGTTVVRALESAVVLGASGPVVEPAGGWTDLVLGPEHPARVVDALVSGLHDPGASHLMLLEAVAGRELVQQAYDEAVANRYLWHEFGDSCLLVPGGRRHDSAGPDGRTVR